MGDISREKILMETDSRSIVELEGSDKEFYNLEDL